MGKRANLFVAMTIACFLALLCYALFELGRIERGLRAEIGESNLWFATQADYEGQRLGQTLFRAVEGHASADEVKIRFDILYSRVGLMVDPNQLNYFINFGLEQRLKAVSSDLETLDLVMTKPDFGPADAAGILPEVGQLQIGLHALANAVALAERDDRNERRSEELSAMKLLLMAFCGIFLSFTAMAALLWRSMRRAQLSQAELEVHRAQLEETVSERTRELESALVLERRAKEVYRSFVITVSHQFRTPISIIDMIARRQAQPDRPGVTPELRKKFGRILEATERLDGIVSGFLSAVELEGDSSRSKAEKFNLNRLVPLVAGQAGMNHPGRSIDIKTSLDEDLVISGDENLLLQAMSNLTSNALSYSQPPTPVEITTGREGEKVFFRVKDYGVGIPLDAQPAIFEHYYRATNVHRMPGVGVGLSLSRDIVSLQGGAITFNSEEGKGSEFTIWLPACGEN